MDENNKECVLSVSNQVSTTGSSPTLCCWSRSYVFLALLDRRRTLSMDRLGDLGPSRVCPCTVVQVGTGQGGQWDLSRGRSYHIWHHLTRMFPSGRFLGSWGAGELVNCVTDGKTRLGVAGLQGRRVGNRNRNMNRNRSRGRIRE
jgi:hypothetical protein